jgi:hypothetical protein
VRQPSLQLPGTKPVTWGRTAGASRSAGRPGVTPATRRHSHPSST